jgi:ADP-ribose pyrophosphatase YjhB (NUDIX family)|uniref:Nudix hydrolase domain-containing protein n=1 Tax=viral metagenome TaxID=1070528 RepID=A0A6C0IWR5_9ZZZZ
MIYVHFLDENDRMCLVDDDDIEIKPITSAGILPFAVLKKKVFFLLGKESFEPTYGESDRWSDFSGKLNEGETIERGASREFYEETAGCIMTLNETFEKLSNGDYMLHSDLHPRHSCSFRTYLVLIPYKDYPAIFRRVKLFIQYPDVHGDTSVIEKSHVQWFTFEEVHDIIFDCWKENRYKRKVKFRAKFSENIRRIMNTIDLKQHCIDAYAASYNNFITCRPRILSNTMINDDDCVAYEK